MPKPRPSPSGSPARGNSTPSSPAPASSASPRSSPDGRGHSELTAALSRRGKGRRLVPTNPPGKDLNDVASISLVDRRGRAARVDRGDATNRRVGPLLANG